MTTTKTLDYSIIVPVYNAEFTLEELVNRLNQVMNKITSLFEIILVNDKSADNSWQAISDLEKQHSHVIGICLEKNSGRHHAIIVGCEKSRGKRAITIDDDLQHRPEDIPALIKKKLTLDLTPFLPSLNRNNIPAIKILPVSLNAKSKSGLIHCLIIYLSVAFC